MIAIEDYQFFAVVIFLVAGTGVVCNALVAVFTRRLKTLNNPFGRLTGSQATAEIIQCSVFAFYYSPMVFFDIKAMKDHSNIAGGVLLVFYDICIFSHLIIALNRLCAICFPLKYDRYFSKRNTTTIIVVIWIVSLIVPTAFHGRWDCNLAYTDAIWAFTFRNDRPCGLLSWYVDFGQDLTVAIIIAIADTITIAKVRATSKQVCSSRQMASKRKSDINFLTQAVAQGVVFATELFTYFFVAWYIENKFVFFCFTTLAWSVVHTSDGIVIIVFNKEFRRVICSPFQSSSRVRHSNARTSDSFGTSKKHDAPPSTPKF